MKKTTIMTAFFAVLISAPYVAAQRDGRFHETGVVTVVNNDTVDASRVEKHLRANAPSAPKDNGLPRFAIVGKDDKFYVGLGAQFLGEAAFDFGDRISSPVLFTPSAMEPVTPGNGGSIGFGWQSSSVYLNFVAMPGSRDQIGIFFKGNFLGNNNSFNCYHFYTRYRGATIGYTTSVFTDAAAEPMTIDFEGPNGYPYMTLFTASWTQKINERFSGAIGIEAPTASITTGSGTAQVSQRIPAVPLYVQYAWDGGASHLRLSGIVRPIQYRNLEKNCNTTLGGLGVQISGMSQIVGPLTVNYNVAYGNGIGSYLQDDNGLGLDAVALSDKGEMGMVRTMGVTAGLGYTFSPRVSSNLVYSHLTNWLPDEAVSQDSQYRYGDYVAANVIYKVNSFVSAGIEYDYGHRKSFDGESLHANRIQMQFAVTF